MKKTLAKWEKIKYEVFSKVFPKDIFDQMPKNLKVSQRANISGTEITVFIYSIHTHTQILYFFFVFSIFKHIQNVYNKWVNIFS